MLLQTCILVVVLSFNLYWDPDYSVVLVGKF